MSVQILSANTILFEPPEHYRQHWRRIERAARFTREVNWRVPRNSEILRGEAHYSNHGRFLWHFWSLHYEFWSEWPFVLPIERFSVTFAIVLLYYSMWLVGKLRKCEVSQLLLSERRKKECWYSLLDGLLAHRKVIPSICWDSSIPVVSGVLNLIYSNILIYETNVGLGFEFRCSLILFAA